MRLHSEVMRHGSSFGPFVMGCLVLMSAAMFSGCSTPKSPFQAIGDLEPQTLQPGDTIKVSFPGAENLEATQQIRRDGKINLYLAGEVVAADKTPAQLEKELIQVMGPQLVSKQVNVTVLSSAYWVFVTGAVMKPGKITAERSITALEAVMEAGGFDREKANMKEVVVIRHEDGKVKRSVLNLKHVLDGKSTEPFYLKSRDILFVEEKFTWF